MLKKIVAFGPAVVWAFFILVGCIMNVSQFPKLYLNWFSFGIDKLAHFVLFGTQALLLNIAWVHYQKNKFWYLIGAIISAVYGILIEQLQGTFFIYRTYELEDMYANCLGAFCYSLVLFVFDPLFKKAVSMFWPSRN